MSPIDRDTRVGFVGLGNLGEPMALALLDAGWRVRVLDRVTDRVRACRRAGAEVAERVSDLDGCGVVALAVPDDAAVSGVLDELLDVLTDGSVVVVHSTVLPETARREAVRAGGYGVGLLDAPVSGGAGRAREGRLTVMVGGDADVLALTRPVLDTVGGDVFHVGPPGSGAAVKLANQLMMFASLAGVHEALELAAAHGVAESDVLSVVGTGTGDSWVARNWGFFDQVAAAYDDGGTPVRERPWSKDLWDVVAAARAADVPVPVAGLLAQYLADRVESHAARQAAS